MYQFGASEYFHRYEIDQMRNLAGAKSQANFLAVLINLAICY